MQLPRAVMKGIEVEYVDHMGDDLRVANVARVSFDKWKEELDDKDVKLIHYLANHEHTSPFRHAILSVRCTAPIFLARQLAKHQVGLSWNEVSRRYVDSAPEFFCPDEWRARPDKGIKQGSGDYTVSLLSTGHKSVKDMKVYDAYDQVVDQCVELYETMLENNVAPEMARMVLPQSMLTSWIWTGSIQAFFHMYCLRIDSHAQKEAQYFAELLGDIVVKYFPHSWQALLDSN